MFKKEKKERKKKKRQLGSKSKHHAEKNVAHLKSNALYIYIYLYSIQNCIMASNQFLEKRTLLKKPYFDFIFWLINGERAEAHGGRPRKCSNLEQTTLETGELDRSIQSESESDRFNLRLFHSPTALPSLYLTPGNKYFDKQSVCSLWHQEILFFFFFLNVSVFQETSKGKTFISRILRKKLKIKRFKKHAPRKHTCWIHDDKRSIIWRVFERFGLETIYFH